MRLAYFSNVLNAISASGANVLTINQTIPINNVANVTISIETGELVIGLTKLLNKIAKMQGVMSLKITAEGVNLMANIAVLGYGTVGSGVVEVLNTNKDRINSKSYEPINIKYVLDLRDFPGDPV